jgi:hypothetical protein
MEQISLKNELDMEYKKVTNIAEVGSRNLGGGENWNELT